MDIRKELFELQDEEYRNFNGKLVPDVELIGVRVPLLRKFAKKISSEYPGEAEEFLGALPHRFLEENHLHAFLLEEEKDRARLVMRAERFLPYIDNWQTCDSFLPAYFKRDSGEVPLLIDKWLASDGEFTVRYAMRLLLARKDFCEEDILKIVKAGNDDRYYVYMGAAWYLSMAAKANEAGFQRHFNLRDMDERLMDATLRKICESRQFSVEEKDMYRERAEKEKRNRLQDG